MELDDGEDFNHRSVKVDNRAPLYGSSTSDDIALSLADIGVIEVERVERGCCVGSQIALTTLIQLPPWHSVGKARQGELNARALLLKSSVKACGAIIVVLVEACLYF